MRKRRFFFINFFKSQPLVFGCWTICDWPKTVVIINGRPYVKLKRVGKGGSSVVYKVCEGSRKKKNERELRFLFLAEEREDLLSTLFCEILIENLGFERTW